MSSLVFPFLLDVEEEDDEDDDPDDDPPKLNWDCVRHTALDSTVMTWILFMLT